VLALIGGIGGSLGEKCGSSYWEKWRLIGGEVVSLMVRISRSLGEKCWLKW
jgi:hypothetical protein